MQINMSDFFRFLPAYQRGALKVRPVIGYSGDIFDDINPQIHLNKIRVSIGKRLCDIVTFHDGLGFCVSERFKEAVEAHSLTGLRFWPLELEDSSVQLYGIQFTNFLRSKAPRAPGETAFFLSEWTGEDFFSLGSEACTARAKRILEKAKITNLEFADDIQVLT
jgi:hypothetical protein